MSSITPGEALLVTRKMLRGFAGAPDPRRHAEKLYSELIHAEGWSRADDIKIRTLGAWLNERPGLHELKPHCAAVLAQLGQIS